LAARGVGWAVDECSPLSDFYLEELAFGVQFGAKVGCLPRVGCAAAWSSISVIARTLTAAFECRTSM
jgi:hypothetical protein